MKHRLQIILLIFFINFVNGQNSNWIEIKKNYFLKSIVENSNEFLQENDSINLLTFEAEEPNGEKENFDFGKFLYGEKTTFADLKFKLNIELFTPNLKRNSEYLIKIELPNLKLLKYNIWLQDSAKSKEINKLQEFLKSNYQVEKLVFISKQDAAKAAKKELGIDSGELFEENIFPASFELTTKNKINLNEIKAKFPKIIDDIRSNEPELKSITLKIKT